MKRKFIGLIFALLLIVFVCGVGAVSASMTASITQVSITSDITGHTTQFTDGSRITASFDSSEELHSVDDLKITDGLTISFGKIQIDGCWHYEGSATVPEDLGQEYKSCSDLKVQVTDKHGSSDTIDFGHLLYYPDMSIGSFICQSDNKVNKKVAIDGSKVVFSFTANQPVSICGTPKFLGEDLIFISSDDRTFVGAYTVTGFDEDKELKFPIVKVKDFLGNEYDASCDDAVLYYKSDVISDCRFTTSNADGKSAIEGDTLTYSFKSNRELKITGKVSIGGEGLTLSEKKNGTFDYTYSCSYKVKENRWEDLASVGADASGAKYSDNCGYENMALPEVTDTVIFYRALEKGQNVTDYTFTTANAGKDLEGRTVSKNGDTLTMKFRTNRKVNVDSAAINGKDVTFASADGLNYEASLVISDGADNQEIPVNVVVSDPITGTEAAFTEADLDKIVYYAPIVLTLDVYKSDHTMDHCCINGNTITAKFHSDHPIAVTDVKIGSNDAEAQSTDGLKWIVTMDVKDNFTDLEDIGFTLRADDRAGNTGTLLKEDRPIKYYAPLEKDHNITDLRISSSNTGKTFAGLRVIKTGDSVSISFKANRAVSVKDAYIGNEAAAVSSVDNKEWTVTATIGSWSDDAVIPIRSTITDMVGNPSLDLSENDFEYVVFYDAIDIQSDSFETNNPAPMLAKNGDTATVDFHTNHPVNIDSASIGKYDVRPTSNDGINWTMTLAVDNNFEDLEGFGFSVSVSDNASNVPKTLTNKGTIVYYAPIAASGLELASSNDKDGRKYVKDGEEISVSLKTNHPVLIDAVIDGEGAAIVSNIPEKILLTGGTGDLSDQQAVHFNIDLKDAAGNIYPALTEADAKERIIYFAPITGTVSMTASCSKTEGYVRNGDSLTISIQTNHETNGTYAEIQDREIAVTGNRATYTIPEDEGHLAEGKISYHIDADDAAGNTFGSGETTSVIYDRTPPVIQIAPELRGFTNRKVDVKAIVQDTNIDQSDIAIRLNDEDHTAGGNASETVYEKGLSIDKEGTFHVEASAADKAGNVSRSVSGTVIVDKTDPRVTAIDIDLNDAPAYKTGLVLADHFNIKDAYLKNINCTLTNRTGIGSTRSWNIFAGIWDEGLMTCTISAEDMASNISESVRFNFYTDGTAPKIIVRDRSTGKVIDEKTTFGSGIDRTFEICLDKIWVGNERPDRFTVLEVKDSKNNAVKNFITGTDIDTAEYKITEEGEYTLVCKAKDDVGNETREMKFKIKADAGSVTVVPTTKDEVVKIAWIAAACAAGIGISAVVIALIIRRKENHKTQ